jgi:hypothetical protein
LYKFFNLLLELKKKTLERNCIIVFNDSAAKQRPWNVIEKANVIVCSCGGEKKEKFAFRLFEPIQDKKKEVLLLAGRDSNGAEPCRVMRGNYLFNLFFFPF